MDIKTVLSIENLNVVYQTDGGLVYAVNDLNMEISPGSVLGLVGETGAGKTTTALSIMGLLPDRNARVTSGKIIFQEQDLLQMDELQNRQLRGNAISMIFQDPMTALNPVMKVGNQIAESFVKHQKMSRIEAMNEAKNMLKLVGIPEDRADEYPHQFSGGMRQRVIIAMALACNPQLLIADEPTTALDVTIQAQVLDLMRNILERYDTSMLMITHDLGVVAEICDEVAIMYSGRIIEKGTLKDIFKNRKHPYTIGLFNSLPDVDKKDERLKPIKGEMPDPTALPSGCSFYPRCPLAKEICACQIPRITDLEPGHSIACLAYEPEYMDHFDLSQSISEV